MESRGTSDPEHVLIVVNTHHLPPAHAHEGVHCNWPVGKPEVHHPNLSLGIPVWTPDHSAILNLLLKNEVRPLIEGNAVDILFGWPNLHTAPGKRKERLEHSPIQVAREGFEIGEETCFWNG